MKELVPQPEFEYEDDSPEIRTGTWYWVKADEDDRGKFRDENEDGESLWCVTHIGSNYVHFKNVYDYTWRMHFNDFLENCRLEPDAPKLIGDAQEETRKDVRKKLGEIENLTRRLGLNPRYQLTHQQQMEYALVPVSGTENLKSYKRDLVKAKEETLPKLFEEFKDLHEELAAWMKADLIPLESEVDKFETATDSIKERIFHVELYSGLVESAKLVKKGKPASPSTKIHLMQRRFYMDEECLLDYQSGGMNFKRIEDFDKWLSKECNFARILPHQRCVVAFQVRRNRKEYDYDGSLSAFITFTKYDQWDKMTFLYIRNGDRLYRIETEINFGEKLFPNIKEFNPEEPLWADVWSGGSIHKLMPDSERTAILKEYREAKKKHKKWCKQWVGKKIREGVPTRVTIILCGVSKQPERRYDEGDSPYYFEGTSRSAQECESMKLINKENVYYDDVMEHINGEVKQYNRIVLILQGLLDRSQVFHPHPIIRLWKAEHFAEHMELVYDADRALYAGEKPDFEAYRKRLNESLCVGAHTVGQELYWEKKEAQKENKRLDNDWRNKSDYRHKTFRPYGNPGPGLIAEVTRYQPRVKKCGFAWERERSFYSRSSWYRDNDGPVRCTLTVPVNELLNVDAYQKGEYKKFFNDPRTREEYLKWAPLLLAAEDFKGKKKKKGR